jgi:maltokinase
VWSPDPATVAAARWYGGKGAAISSIGVDDVLELGPGCALVVFTVETADGGRERYLDVRGAVGGPLLQRLCGGGAQGDFVFRPAVGLTPPAGNGRPLGADQSNTSLVVDERWVVKLYRRLHPGIHPEVELVAHLSGDGLEFVPAYGGTVAWNGHAVALVQAYVPGAVDGWAWAEGAVVAGDVGQLVGLGGQTAVMHRALAELGVGVADPGRRAQWVDGAEAQLDRALTLLEAGDLARVQPHIAQVRNELAQLATAGEATLQRVHGDYHVGQVLMAPAGLRVIDFEGEPTKPVAERRLPGCPLRDVAAMLRSFDHLIRHVEREVRPGHLAAYEEWMEQARAAFLEGYGPVDADLLRAFEVEKETYEFVYARTFLPEWTHTAVSGLGWLMGERA